MAMTASGGDEGEVLSDINVTPLVDVMLVLLIIFIITVPVALKEIKVNLPKASNLPTQTKPENIVIAVTEDETTYYNNVPVDQVTMLNNFVAALKRGAAIDKLPEVHIRGDSDSRYMYVGQVLVAAQKIGIRKVAFLTSPLHPGEAP